MNAAVFEDKLREQAEKRCQQLGVVGAGDAIATVLEIVADCAHEARAALAEEMHAKLKRVPPHQQC